MWRSNFQVLLIDKDTRSVSLLPKKKKYNKMKQQEEEEEEKEIN